MFDFVCRRPFEALNEIMIDGFDSGSSDFTSSCIAGRFIFSGLNLRKVVDLRWGLGRLLVTC